MSPPAVGSSVAPHHGNYPSEENTTANHLPAYCDYCHDLFTEHIGFISFVPSGRRTGASTGRGWGAVVSGGSRPRVGEVVAIWLRCSGAWRDYVVTGVIDGGGREPDRCARTRRVAMPRCGRSASPTSPGSLTGVAPDREGPSGHSVAAALHGRS